LFIYWVIIVVAISTHISPFIMTSDLSWIIKYSQSDFLSTNN